MHPFEIKGPSGRLEAVISYPKDLKFSHITALICHPHPLYQGTMNNKVVTTIARSFNTLGIQALRFNYRGVGKSEGRYGEGTGELQDVLAVIDTVRRHQPAQKIILCGFSFGGAVAYKAASKRDNILSLLTIAPAIVNFPVTDFPEPAIPWCLVQGLDDEIVDAKAVIQFAGIQNQSEVAMIKLNHVGHFFHGQLVKLKNEIIHYYQPRLSLW